MTMTIWNVTGYPVGALVSGSAAMSIAAADAAGAIRVARSALARNGLDAAYNLTAKAE